MRWTVAAMVAAAVCFTVAADEEQVAKLEKEGFVRLFDGKTLSGWKAADNPGSWSVTEDGAIKASGERSHLFSPKEYTDFELYAEVKTEPKSNGGIFFRTEFGPEWPKGYESQVANTHGDPQKTGGIYNLAKVFKQHVKDGEWWSQHIICKGNHIIVKLNGKTVVDFTDKKNTHSKGHFALQQHDPSGTVYYRNVMVKDLSESK
jgi:hypothetical protein